MQPLYFTNFSFHCGFLTAEAALELSKPQQKGCFSIRKVKQIFNTNPPFFYFVILYNMSIFSGVL